MTRFHPSSTRILVVGGGISGLSIAARLAQAGLPVSLLEATALGFGASTRNQGWLLSGGWFAPEHPALRESPGKPPADPGLTGRRQERAIRVKCR